MKISVRVTRVRRLRKWIEEFVSWSLASHYISRCYEVASRFPFRASNGCLVSRSCGAEKKGLKGQASGALDKVGALPLKAHYSA